MQTEEEPARRQIIPPLGIVGIQVLMEACGCAVRPLRFPATRGISTNKRSPADLTFDSFGGLIITSAKRLPA